MSGFLTAQQRRAPQSLQGQANGLVWQARLAQGRVHYGLDARSLCKGYGRIVEFSLYRPVPGAVHMIRLAHFKAGWHYGRSRHLRLIEGIVHQIEGL